MNIAIPVSEHEWFSFTRKFMFLAAASPLSRDLHAKMTLYPLDANLYDNSNPMPVLDPVTIASGREFPVAFCGIWKHSSRFRRSNGSFDTRLSNEKIKFETDV